MSKTRPILLSGKALDPLVNDLQDIIVEMRKLAHPDRTADAQALEERFLKALEALDMPRFNKKRQQRIFSPDVLGHIGQKK